MSKGVSDITAVHSYQIHLITELIENQWLTQGAMATNT